MYIEITEKKLNKATDYAEKMLKYGGMLMQCLTEWEEENGMHHERINYRDGGHSRYSGGEHTIHSGMGYRDDDDWDDDDWDDDDEMMHERRRRSRRTGRYM